MERFTVVVDASLEPIMPRYLKLRREELAAMEAALDAGHAESLRLLGHRLKGTGASYGFEELTRLGSAIEILAQAADLRSAAGLVAEVRQYLENMDVVFEERD